ncbi:Phospholipid phosphatase 2 [Nymphon striatum]|nr:Phospholipid phosphatase 2 [Nymphon striatum]
MVNYNICKCSSLADVAVHKIAQVMWFEDVKTCDQLWSVVTLEGRSRSRRKKSRKLTNKTNVDYEEMVKSLKLEAVDPWSNVLSALFILSITGAIAPRKGGFYCNDVYLNKKYTGDTIGIGLLLSVSILVPILFIYLSELWQHGTIDTSKKVFNRRRFSSGSKFSRYIVSDFLLGILFTLTLTDIIKDMVSEKRPHFLETCQPTVICGLNNSSSSSSPPTRPTAEQRPPYQQLSPPNYSQT